MRSEALLPLSPRGRGWPCVSRGRERGKRWGKRHHILPSPPLWGRAGEGGMGTRACGSEWIAPRAFLWNAVPPSLPSPTRGEGCTRAKRCFSDWLRPACLTPRRGSGQPLRTRVWMGGPVLFQAASQDEGVGGRACSDRAPTGSSPMPHAACPTDGAPSGFWPPAPHA